MTSGYTGLWERLRAAGLVEGEAPPEPVAVAPWYVRTMIGIAGWVAALFVFGFVGLGLSHLLNTPSLSLVVGLVVCVMAAAMFRTLDRYDFMVQFAFAASLAGQALFALGLLADHGSRSGIAWVVVALFETALLVAVRYGVHRVWSAFAAAVAVLVALHQWSAAPLFPGILAAGFAGAALTEARFARHASLWHATVAGLAVALLAYVPSVVLMSPFAFGEAMPAVPALAWIGAASAGAVLVATAATILARQHVAPASRTGTIALGGTLLLAALAAPFPAVVASLVLLLVAWQCGNRPLLGVGLVAIVGTLGYYYYSLQATLLFKSCALLAMGAVLLGAAWALRHWSPIDAAGGDHA